MQQSGGYNPHPQGSHVGAVSDFQEFLIGNCAPTLYSAAHSHPPPSAAAAAPAVGVDLTVASTGVSPGHHHLKYHHLLSNRSPHLPTHHHHHHHHQPPPPPPEAALPQNFAYFQPAVPVPFVQQLLSQQQQSHQEPPHHQFQFFHNDLDNHQHEQEQQQQQQRVGRLLHPHHSLGLDLDLLPNNSGCNAAVDGVVESGAAFSSPIIGFKLGVGVAGTGDGIDGDGVMLHQQDAPPRAAPVPEPGIRHWHCDEEVSIKKPTWRPLDLDYINTGSKNYKDKEPLASLPAEMTQVKSSMKGKEVNSGDTMNVVDAGQASATSVNGNYKLFSELEAIYKHGSSGGGGAPGGGTKNASGSVITGEENQLIPAVTAAFSQLERHVVVSETSAGGEDGTNVGKKTDVKSSSSCSRRKRKRRQRRQQLQSLAEFFEWLVQQLMEHQEGLHARFLEALDRRERDRTSRDEAWRLQEAARLAREAADRARDRALSAAREAVIVSFLEKLSGESVVLPDKPDEGSMPMTSELNKNDADMTATTNTNKGIVTTSTWTANPVGMLLSSSRWPRMEVEALIRIRSSLELRFQEPGAKGPLWEEVSRQMAALGFNRIAKRCKEKWENINKYFRKAKESGKKRPRNSKTCLYFDELDQLYSKSGLHLQPLLAFSPAPLATGPSSSPELLANPVVANSSVSGDDRAKGCNSELLDAVGVATDMFGPHNEYLDDVGKNANTDACTTETSDECRDNEEEEGMEMLENCGDEQMETHRRSDN